MISALSRRLPLSGSKLWVVLLSLLLIGACSSQKKTAGPPKGYEVVDTKTKPSKPVKESPKDTILPPIGDIVDTLPKYTHKPFYNVALVLPFYLDSFPTASGGIYPPSRIGAEYYQGVLAALDTLKKHGLSVKLHVFDSYPETYLDVLIKGGKLKNMDLIIGPVFNTSMKLMAKYALETGIPVWSPFSPASDITAKNPFFYIASPRMETHAQKMVQFATDSFKGANFLVLYQNTAQEKSYLDIYRKHFLSLNIKAKEKLIDNHASGLPKISTGEIDALLGEGENVLLVPSMNVPFMVNLLREVYPLAERQDITLIGTPTVGNDVDLQPNYLNALNAHFTQSYFLKPGFYESSFYTTFLEKFGTEPSEYAVNGYDQMFFLGIMMKQFGQGFRLEMKNVAFDGWGNGFGMRPATLQPSATDTVPSIDFWDNQHLYILRYNDYVLEKAR